MATVACRITTDVLHCTAPESYIFYGRKEPSNYQLSCNKPLWRLLLAFINEAPRNSEPSLSD
jgi:hypothetical protein